MGVACLGKEARLQNPPELSPGTARELGRPGDAGSDAGPSSPSDRLIIKVSTRPGGGFAFGLLTWQQKGKKNFLVFKPMAVLALYKDLKYFGVKEVSFQAPEPSKALGSRDIWKLCRLVLVTYYFILVPF